MTKKSILACEREQLMKMKYFQIPHRFKKIGVGLFVLSLIALLLNKFLLEIPELKTTAKYGMLLGLLLVSIAKEKIEDELVTQIRMQSYSLAFIVGVLAVLFVSMAENMLDFAFAAKENVTNESMQYYTVVWMLLGIQVCYFEMLKRMHK